MHGLLGILCEFFGVVQEENFSTLLASRATLRRKQVLL